MSKQDSATALSIGCVANEWLIQQRPAIDRVSVRRASLSCSTASVVAVFDRCLYVATDVVDPNTKAIDVSCIGTESIGRGGLNIVASSSFQSVLTHVRAGDPVTVESDRLFFAQQPLLLGQAQIYRTQLATLNNATVACQRLQPYCVSTLPPGLDSALFRSHANEGMQAVAAFLDRNVDGQSDEYFNVKADETFHELLGLGVGLTPAGDDFLAGALIALRSLDQLPLCRRLGESLLCVAAHRTNRISAAHLRAAAAGQCAHALGALIDALTLSGADELERATGRLSEVGETSGRDALCGVMFALQWASARE